MFKGKWKFELTLNANGDVAKAAVLRGREPLRDAALKAAQRWRFSPRASGPSQVIVTYDFRIID